MKAVLKNILLKKTDREGKDDGVIYTDKKIERFGEIISKGEDVPNSLRVGDVVRFKEHIDGEHFSVENEQYVILNYEGILYVSLEYKS